MAKTEKPLARMMRYLGGYKAQIGLYFFTSLLAVLFSVFSFGMIAPVLQVLFLGQTAASMPTGSGLLGKVLGGFNKLLLAQSPDTALLWIVIIIVGFTVLKNMFLYLSLNILNPIRNGVVRQLRDELFTKTLSLPIGFFTEERKGNLLSRMTNDVNEVEQSIMNVLETFIREPLMIIITLTAMVLISVKLTLFLLLFLPLTGVLIGWIGKSLKTTSNIAQEQLGDMMGITDETLSGMRVVKAFNAETHQRLRFLQLNNLNFRTKNRLAARRDLGSPLSETMGILAVGVILWYGGRLIFSHQGTLTGPMFMAYIALFSQVINPFKNLSSAYNNVQKGSGAIARIEELLNAENTITELPDAQSVSGFEHSIELRNVSFTYGDKQILSNINLTIPKGKTIALVGSSGAGKSTLVDLIPRFHDVTGGEVLLDGVNIRNLKLQQVRRLMGVVSQEPILFNDTVYNNITLGTGGATEERVAEAARVAYAASFIEAKPDGYQTIVGDRGTRLSGGERQRITIARAVLKNPPILILDEATSSLDTESERAVQAAINQLMQGRTCIVIAHRLSTVQHADEIIVLQKGQIAERGTHTQLMQQGGLYQKLVAMQEVK